MTHLRIPVFRVAKMVHPFCSPGASKRRGRPGYQSSPNCDLIRGAKARFGTSLYTGCQAEDCDMQNENLASQTNFKSRGLLLSDFLASCALLLFMLAVYT